MFEIFVETSHPIARCQWHANFPNNFRHLFPNNDIIFLINAAQSTALFVNHHFRLLFNYLEAQNCNFLCFFYTFFLLHIENLASYCLVLLVITMNAHTLKMSSKWRENFVLNIDFSTVSEDVMWCFVHTRNGRKINNLDRCQAILFEWGSRNFGHVQTHRSRSCRCSPVHLSKLFVENQLIPAVAWLLRCLATTNRVYSEEKETKTRNKREKLWMNEWKLEGSSKSQKPWMENTFTCITPSAMLINNVGHVMLYLFIHPCRYAKWMPYIP